MSELHPRGRDLIEAARLELSPTNRDRERILSALVAGTCVATLAATTTAAPSLLAKLTSGAAKWWLVGGLCAAGLGGVPLVTSLLADPPEVTNPPQGAAPASTEQAPQPTASPPPVLVPVTPGGPGTEVLRPAPGRAAAAKAQPPASDLELELSSLRRAHAAYRGGRPSEALQLVSEHRRRFPKSQLSNERSTLEVLSLCQVGRQPEARRLAERLRRAAPTSAAVSGLEGSCAATRTK